MAKAKKGEQMKSTHWTRKDLDFNAISIPSNYLSKVCRAIAERDRISQSSRLYQWFQGLFYPVNRQQKL